MKDLISFAQWLRPALVAVLVLYGFSVLLAALVNLAAATIGLRNRKGDPWQLALAGGEHWLLLSLAAVAFVAK